MTWALSVVLRTLPSSHWCRFSLDLHLRSTSNSPMAVSNRRQKRQRTIMKRIWPLRISNLSSFTALIQTRRQQQSQNFNSWEMVVAPVQRMHFQGQCQTRSVFILLELLRAYQSRVVSLKRQQCQSLKELIRLHHHTLISIPRLPLQSTVALAKNIWKWTWTVLCTSWACSTSYTDVARR